MLPLSTETEYSAVKQPQKYGQTNSGSEGSTSPSSSFRPTVRKPAKQMHEGVLQLLNSAGDLKPRTKLTAAIW